MILGLRQLSGQCESLKHVRFQAVMTKDFKKDNVIQMGWNIIYKVKRKFQNDKINYLQCLLN